MALRYLFGPVSREFSDDTLSCPRESGDYLTFQHDPGADLALEPADTWESFQARLPADWQPDFIALYLPYRTIPAWLWSAPVPIIGLAGDWNLLWHCYRGQLSRCDLILSDVVGVERLRKDGHKNVWAWKMYGASRSIAEATWPEVTRDIDILFVGLHAAPQQERLPWLARLAQLSTRWNVVLATGVYGDDYRSLLARAKIVFNRGARGEWNQRVGETLAAGALLFQEADNREVPPELGDRRECVLYTADNLESLLRYYLEHDDQRRTIAAAGKARLADFTFEKLWDKLLGKIERHLSELKERAQARAAADLVDELEMRAWQCVNTSQCVDVRLQADIRSALDMQPRSARLLSCLGLALGWPARARTPEELSAIASAFQQAWMSDPRHALAGLNLAEVLAEMGRGAEALAQARRTLAMLDRHEDVPASLLDGGHYPSSFDDFRVAWERAGWEHAGERRQEMQAKMSLLRWRLHVLMGVVSGDLAHLYEAVAIRPDLTSGQVLLGRILAGQQRWTEALRLLQMAHAADPFDADVARLMHDGLVKQGDLAGQQRLERECRLLHRTAPTMLSDEAWFGAPCVAVPKVAQQLSIEDFNEIYGRVDCFRALSGFTPPKDTEIVLTLLKQCEAERILEIGTAAGHMTANLTEWSGDDAKVFSIGITAGMPGAAVAQRPEDPPASAFGAQIDHFGKGQKVTLIAADSLAHDFRSLAPIDFAFIDGAHDLRHVWSDSHKIYDILSPGGVMVWHDYGSPTPWVEVRQALERLPFAEPIEHVEGTQVAFLRKCKESATTPASDPARITWEGGFTAMHSLALINRELCARLHTAGHELRIILTEHVEQGSPLPLPTELADCLADLAEPAEVHVAHQWPPSFTPPAAGHWVIMQPWEFGSLPKSWIDPMTHQVDEVWVPSRFVRDCFIKSGIPADQVHVVPLGVDCRCVELQSDPLPLTTRKNFKFLFVGGTIQRKGIDLLLSAYQSVFSDRDDVCLVIKDMGVSSFYRGQTAEPLLQSFRSQPHAPEIEYLDQDLSADDMDRLYRACDCLVHPFRGEGFGLPIVEAMAHGLPAIVTGYGPVLDYATADRAFLLSARQVTFSVREVDGHETVDYPWLAEPDIDQLRYCLRRVVDEPARARHKGQSAQAFIRHHFTWEQTVAAVAARVQELRKRPIRRQRVRAAPVSSYIPEGIRRRSARVSLCMIVKNEETHLEACLRSAADLVDDIVIVDTGSTDRTASIAAAFGATVVPLAWQDSFAAARNESVHHARGDWIFWLDADEQLDEVNRQRLRTLFDRLGNEPAGYLMRQHSKLEGPAYAAAAVDQLRLFPKHPHVRWQYRVHEQILPSLRAIGADVRLTDIIIDHGGFAETGLQGAKVERNLRLLHMELTEHPTDPFVLYNLGAVALTQGKREEAIGYLHRALEHSQPHDTVVGKAYVLLVRAYQELGRREQALTLCRRGKQTGQALGELTFLEAVLLHEQGLLPEAERCLTDILQTPPAQHFMGFDAGLFGYRTRAFLGEVYLQQGKQDAAEAEWRRAVAECPSFSPAWLKLGELWLAQKRWGDVQEAVRKTHTDLAASLDATLLWCRALLAQREFTDARRLLERVLVGQPRLLPAKVLLSHVLLQEGKHPVAAERVLRDILSQDAQHAEAAHNLQVLESQSRQHGSAPDDAVPEPLVVVTPQVIGSRPRVSLSMIVKNEEHNLPACLESVADLVDELVIVDTGSTDGTKEVAARFGARVFDFPWVDSFAAARNESLKRATGDWVFWMDADDRLNPDNRDKFRSLLTTLPADMAGYAMKCLCLPDPKTKTTTVVDHLRLFRNHPDLAWKYRVHEQILPALRRLNATVHWTDITIQHVGYRDGELRRKKLDRDLRLLLMEQAEQPDDAFTLFNLGSVYQELGNLTDALPLFKRSLERSCPTDSIVRKLYALVAQCHNHLGEKAEALVVCRQGRALFPDDAELLFQEGITLRHLGDTSGAIDVWEQLLRTPDGAHFASVNTGLRGYLTRHNLAAAYLDQGQLETAEGQWRAALADYPSYPLALLGLAEVALRQQRDSDVEQLLERLGADDQAGMEVEVFRARLCLARKEYAAAQSLLQQTIAAHPNAVWPRVILSHVLLQEGRDWDFAEQVLRGILELEPGHAEARQNLEVLLRQRRRE